MSVIDYAWGQPGVLALRSVGAVGVARYLSWLPNEKVIDKTEYSELVNAGLDVILVWEFRATDFKDSGFDAYGAAEEALRQATALGYAGAIYYAIDWDVTFAEWSMVYSRLRNGPNIVHGMERTGIYGPWYAIEWAARDGLATWFWQAGMSTAWSNGTNRYSHPRAHLVQRSTRRINAVDCDINEICQSNYGQTGGNIMQLTGPDPWGTGGVNEQAGQLRNGYHLLASGYQPDGANENGVIARLDRIEKAMNTLTDAQLEKLITELAARLDGVEKSAVAAALREVLGGLDDQ